MALWVRNIKQVLVQGQSSRSWLHVGVKSKQGMAFPSNIEEIAASTKVGFAADRHRDISHGVCQDQVSSMFGASFMSDQSSLGTSEAVAASCPTDQMVENYNFLGSMSLNAVTQTNVPQPFSPDLDTTDAPRLNMPENQSQQNKFTASDLQDTLHPIVD